ncbi:MAG: acetyl-CoA hydrolase/transferase family protein [Candidatus Binataceae bacterium]
MPQEMLLEDLDLAAIIRSGDHIVWGQGAGEPSTLVEKLLEQRHRIGHANVFLGGVRSQRMLKPEHADALTFTSFGAMGNLHGLASAGLLRIIPAHLSQLHGYFEQGLIPADVVFVQLSAADENGQYSFGIANDFQHVAMARARVVIAEVNDQLPWTYCDRLVDPARIDYVVRTSRLPAQVRAQPIGPVEETIARHVARYIEDGTTIQIGVGAIPDAVLAGVGDRRDLGIHSGLISDRVADLMEAGVVSNARKPIDTGIAVCALLAGTGRLHQYAHKNRAIRLCTYMHTHHAEILSRLDNIIAINSAIEVDLTGQINAEIAAGAYIGGLGGQGDFVRGVQMASGGRSVIALPATARDGAISRIVPRLESGVVTTARGDADVIVTEFGAAELRAQPLAERVRRMVAISHPDFREALERASGEVARRGG